MLRRSVRGSDLPGRRALQCPVRKEVNGSVTGFSRLNVVSRLIIGFAALFAVTTSVSVYSMIKLNEFNKASAHMLELGERLIEHKERLSDALFPSCPTRRSMPSRRTLPSAKVLSLPARTSQSTSPGPPRSPIPSAARRYLTTSQNSTPGTGTSSRRRQRTEGPAARVAPAGTGRRRKRPSRP